jgi:hypothetical protein
MLKTVLLEQVNGSIELELAIVAERRVAWLMRMAARLLNF